MLSRADAGGAVAGGGALAWGAPDRASGAAMALKQGPTGLDYSRSDARRAAVWSAESAEGRRSRRRSSVGKSPKLIFRIACYSGNESAPAS